MARISRKSTKNLAESGNGATAALARPRTATDAFVAAIADASAAGACLLAWVNPQAFGSFDLLAYAAPLFCIQLPLSFLLMSGVVNRLGNEHMSRDSKLGFVLVPSVAMAVAAPIALGPDALIGVMWLSGTLLFQIVSGRIHREAAVKGAWITFTEGLDADGRSTRSYGINADASAPRGGRVRRWRVEAGHSQVMAGLTVHCGLVLAFLMPFIDVDRLGVTPAVEAASAWSQTLIGGAVGAHYVLAAGVALFVGRMLLQFEGIAPRAGSPEAAPIPDIDSDPVLREIVEKIEGKAPRGQSGAKPKKR